MCCCVVLIKITSVFQAKKLTGLTDITGCFCLDSTNSMQNIETNILIFYAQSASLSQIMPTDPANIPMSPPFSQLVTRFADS